MTRASGASRKILLLGARGMLGCELADRLIARAGRDELAEVTCWDRKELDIRDRDAVLAALTELRCDVVINAAGFTNVDACEQETDEAFAVNAEAPGHLAVACRELDARLVHVSTDFVFDGAAQRPYRPDDPAHPLSAYGRSKWQGERAIAAVECAHLIVRTSWLYGPRGRNFVEAILAQAEKGGPLRVVDDQIGRPTLAGDLADALLGLLDADAEGTLHFANGGVCSWHGFAERIVAEAGLSVAVEKITSAELDRPAPRPVFSVLDTTEYEQLTGHVPDHWEKALSRYFRQRMVAAKT